MVHLSTAPMTRGQRKKLIFHTRLLDNCVTANPVKAEVVSSILKMTSAGTENKLMIMAGLLSLSDWNILAVPHFATFWLLFRKIGKKQSAKAIKITTQTDFLPSQPVCHYNPLLQFLAKHFLVFYVKTFVHGRWRKISQGCRLSRWADGKIEVEWMENRKERRSFSPWIRIVLAGSLYREAPAIGLSSHFCAPLRVFLPRLSRLIDLPQVSRREKKAPKDRKDFSFAVLVTNPVLVAP